MKYLTVGLSIFFGVLFILANSMFVVDQTQQALVLSFGKPIRVEQKPGLKFKIPFIQNAELYDARLLDFEAESKEVIAADQKRLIVDAFVRYRITDPLRFKQTVGSETIMRSRLNSILESSLRQVIGEVPLSAVISEKRTETMNQIKNLVNIQTRSGTSKTTGSDVAKGGFGIEVVDVRIKRADLPPANSEGIYKRMQTEREREAKEFRAKGAEDAQKIRSQADKERTIILAEARKQSEILRGEGDEEATKIFAQAFGQDPQFFKFYRTMQAYKKSLSKDDTTMVLSPDSGFLQEMQ
ncbi:MAG: protease modulator HflC [Alphaproteobacteria bacterium]|nr:protease modulator HflC [Alphaproteobacteria bacterium]